MERRKRSYAKRWCRDSDIRSSRSQLELRGAAAWNDVGVRVIKVEPTLLFGGTPSRPLQIIRVTITTDNTGPSAGAPGSDAEAGLAVRIEGPGVSTPFPGIAGAPEPGGDQTVDVGIEVAAPYRPGSVRQVTVIAEAIPGEADPATARAEASSGRAEARLARAKDRAEARLARAEHRAEITAAEPGWTMWMVSHFHYDPVWWNTQGQFTESRLPLPDEHGALPDIRTTFEPVRLNLDPARRHPDYKSALAAIDNL